METIRLDIFVTPLNSRSSAHTNTTKQLFRSPQFAQIALSFECNAEAITYVGLSAALSAICSFENQVRDVL